MVTGASAQHGGLLDQGLCWTRGSRDQGLCWTRGTAGPGGLWTRGSAGPGALLDQGVCWTRGSAGPGGLGTRGSGGCNTGCPAGLDSPAAAAGRVSVLSGVTMDTELGHRTSSSLMENRLEHQQQPPSSSRPLNHTESSIPGLLSGSLRSLWARRARTGERGALFQSPLPLHRRTDQEVDFD